MSFASGRPVRRLLLEDFGVTLGRLSPGRSVRDAAAFCELSLPENSIFWFLARERELLFPDAMFADLFSVAGGPVVPPSVVAAVMVLQRLEGFRTGRRSTGSPSTCAGVRRRGRRLRCGPGPVRAHGAGGHARAAAPFDTSGPDLRGGAGGRAAAGLVGRRRVLDSTPLYDAVATMDTVTLIRSAVRGLLAAADPELAAALRAEMSSGDDYASNGQAGDRLGRPGRA